MKSLAAFAAAMFVFGVAHARPGNYDESKVAPFTLEDPLSFADGRKLKGPSEWPARRAEILRIFEKGMYGRMPPKPDCMVAELMDEKVTMSEFAIRRRVRQFFRADKSGPYIDWLILRPRFATGPVPVILFLNPVGAIQLLPDDDLTIADGYREANPGPQKRPEKRPAAGASKLRGQWCDPNNRNYWPVGDIIARGYAVMTACYFDIAPDPDKKEDRATKWRRRCFDLWPAWDEAAPDNTKSLMAWAWGLCRGLDLAEREPGLDASRSVVTGCSRLGKAALLAGAYDDRFAVVVPNQTGNGGAPLIKHYFGENIETESKSFPHWFTRSYFAYATKDETIPFDQHMLLACVAPRHLLIEGFDQKWFDTRGEYLACQAASPVWEFLGKPGLPKKPFPPDFDTSCIGSHLGYVRRSGNHGLSPYDWRWMLAFADQAFAQMPKRTAALQIVLPSDVAGNTAFRRAADALQRYWQEICGEKPPVVSVPGGGARTITFGKMPKRPDGCDAYALKSVADGLSVTAVNGRCALYAVYDFLARRGACRWFWDGDVVPKGKAPRLDNLDVNEVSRFPYRGIRYFAHRGLTRFQAEHWGAADWNRELDWCLKARINTVMLRIGQDDLFQKAFPDVVPYPDPAKPLPEAMTGYNNRSLFWPLEYRGELRKQVLEAARDRGLIVPEDFGTMSHWYSRTPVAFLENVKPPFLPQEGGEYGHPTDRVWDIRDPKWLDMYWKLTEASIKNYGKAPPEVLHTVGLGERLCFTNRADNFRMKVQTLDRLVDYAHKKYPSAQVAFASWDFYDAWKPQEVRDQIARLDPSKLLVWDYEADATEPGRSNFTEWNLVGRFPYTFGLFLCYEGALDARADYRTIMARQKLIANDPFCKGYLFWPESSHTDTFLLRYFEANCWRADGPSLKTLLGAFCRDRYGAQAPAFEAAWRCVIAVADAYDYGGCYASSVMPFAPWARRTLMHDTRDAELEDAAAAFRTLSAADLSSAFARRDAIDIARQLTDRLIAREQRRLEDGFAAWRAGSSAAGLERHLVRYERLGALMADLLAQHTDYSLYESFRRLDAVHPVVNPAFGQVLIDNASCYYCRSHQYELARHWYLPVMRDRAQAMRARLAADDRKPFSYGSAFADALHAKLLKTPLDSLRPTAPRTVETLRKTLRTLAETVANERKSGGGRLAFVEEGRKPLP